MKKVKVLKPVTPGQRFRVVNSGVTITKKTPEKSLTKPLPRTGARSKGTITVRGRGGGHKRMYRVVDFIRHDRMYQPAEIMSIEYDPNRSGNIALIKYEDGEKRYILAPEGIEVGGFVEAGEKAKLVTGNALPLRVIPVGTEIHNIELHVGQGGKMVRTAGQSARVMAKDAGFVQIKLPSGEIRLFAEDSYATIGSVSNSEHAQIVLGKAGASRHLGRRPKVRGTAMPAGVHPHGGGEGRTGTGGPPKTLWGKKAHGVRTRNKKNKSSQYIVKRRNQK
ncbi:50S ribosomal protein L2 [bacterium]|nr:50S ribosomal protein L2 [bacterium]